MTVDRFATLAAGWTFLALLVLSVGIGAVTLIRWTIDTIATALR